MKVEGKRVPPRIPLSRHTSHPHSSFLIPHSSFLIPHSSFLPRLIHTLLFVVLRLSAPKNSENGVGISAGDAPERQKKRLFSCFLPCFQDVIHWKSTRTKIFKIFFMQVLPGCVKSVFLQSRFAHLKNGARGRGCALVAGEARGKTGNVLWMNGRM